MTEALSLTHVRNLALEARMIRHILDTSMPETCPGLAKTKPARAQDYFIVRKFSLAPLKRPDRMMAPCPLCSPNAPKYYDGALVWFPLEGIYLAIGLDCAGHSIGRVQADRAEREYRERRSHEADYEFACDNIVVVPAIVRYLEAALPLAEHAEGLLRQLGRSQVRRLLYEATRSRDGRLIVWDKLNPDGSVTDKPTPMELGTVRGYRCLGPSHHVVRDIRILLQVMRQLDQGEDEQAEEWMLDRFHLRADLGLFRKVLVRASDLHRRETAYFKMVREVLSASSLDASQLVV